MSPERWQTIRNIADRAEELEAGARALLLERECDSDPDLRREVEAMLASTTGGRAREALPEQSPFAEIFDRLRDDLGGEDDADSDADSGAAPDPLIGTRLGRFHIKSIIAGGGMGVVYEAVQESPERTVALKMMRRNIASRSAMRRFRLEAEILGHLHHPNIAQIYEAGVHDDGSGGVPYFAMEYILGAKPITEYTTSNNLSTRQRLALFAKVCDAVHHGHQKGIIHRDLKPANILVETGAGGTGVPPVGEPKVIDFGVARATDSDLAVTTQQTDAGQLIGTVQYMSPEQVDCPGADPRDIDTRSDVYSLGVVLYELLTGALPYEASNMTIYQAAQVVKQHEPKRPSLIAPKLRGDLETIILKAIDKDRDRRYQSADELRKEIERYCKGEPIEARRPGPWRRAARWAGRHPIVITTIACATVILLTGAVASLTIHFALREPAHFDMWENSEGAYLKTAGNKILATVGGIGHGSWNVAAILVDRPPAFGGGQVALTWVRGGEGQTDEQLWMCDPKDLTKPIRATSAFLEFPTPLPSGAIAEDEEPERSFIVHPRFLIADVFANPEGDEIVVVHSNRHSRWCIRVYDFDFNVLFEVWHLGPIYHLVWLESSDLLVAAGHRHGRREVEERGYPWGTWPRVVFAVRPTRDRRLGWINDPANPEVLDVVAWYKALPLGYAESFAVETLRPLRDPTVKGDAVELSLVLDEPENLTPPGFSFVIKADGEFWLSSTSDFFQQRRNEFPQDDPKLEDWVAKRSGASVPADG